jgi:Fe-S cluster assembly protein SufD
MTEAPIVINRTRTRVMENDFNFTKEMIPEVKSEQFNAYQREAWEIFSDLPHPTDKDEAWRRTSLSKLDKHSINFNNGSHREVVIPDNFKTPVIEGRQAGQLILFPGGKSRILEDNYQKSSVIFDDLDTVIINNPELVLRTAGSMVHAADGKFAALATAFGNHGVFLYIPRGVKIKEPIHSLFWNQGNNIGVFSHNVIWLEDDAEVTFVQEYASEPDQNLTKFHSGILEVHVGKNASLKMVELQSWGEGVWNIMHERVNVQQNGELTWIFGVLGSHLTKSFSSVDLAGSGATAKVSGFYFADANQHLDMDTEQNHLAPNTTSDLLYKGAVTGAARSVWQGNIYVAPGANGTDGYQANRNLILSNKARADSIPGLEILADDVKCTHGATVGKVDPEQIFYLQSRGLSENEAKHLIVEGFFETIMERIPFQEVQDRFRKAIYDKIDAIA